MPEPENGLCVLWAATAMPNHSQQCVGCGAYLRSLLLRGSTIRPMTVQRDLTQSTASDLRLMLSSGWRSHGETFSWMLDRPMHTMEYGERAILATLKNLDRKQFEQMPFGSEGLWSKVMKACQKEMCIHEIILACKSKRYTYSRSGAGCCCDCFWVSAKQICTGLSPICAHWLLMTKAGSSCGTLPRQENSPLYPAQSLTFQIPRLILPWNPGLQISTGCLSSLA